MRILAVDHGEKRIGLALSDETARLARPLTVLKHISRALDAARVAEIGAEQGVGLILIGQSFQADGLPNVAGRSAARFAEALRLQSDLPIVMWDESMTTRDAQAAALAIGFSRSKRAGHLDDRAAAVLLQSYLDTLDPPPLE
ncbi:MAG: Holliday junction resolvase RuvX [Anaerolineales bacterium]|jgi:putative Holliday junction resolvase|nr:Holliday junction resolvase RuvX [Anaerolineales bacterium]